MAGRLLRTPAFLLLAALSAACDAPADPEVILETRMDALGLEVAAVEPDPSCAPLSIPVCVTNHGEASRVVGPLTLQGQSTGEVEGELAGAALLPPEARRCGQVLVRPLQRSPLYAEVQVPSEGGTSLRGRFEVPACGAGPVAATLVVDGRLEMESACQHVTRRACVVSRTDRDVEVLDLRIRDARGWRVVGWRDLPAWAGADAPVCFLLEGSSPGLGTHTSLLQVKVGGLETTLERVLTVQDDLVFDRVDRFTLPARAKADLVFVIDDDPALEGARVADNLRAWAQFAQEASDVDVRAAVTTTDPAFAGRLLVGASGGPAVLSAEDPLFPERMVERAALLQGAGTPDRGLEAGLAAAHRFGLRRDAYLAIVYVTAGDDVSPGSVDDHARLLLMPKGLREQELTMVAAVVGVPPDGCGFPSGDGATAGSRYVEVANRTGGLLESVCEPDWWQSLANLTRVAHSARSRLFLRKPPVPESIEVQITDAEGVTRISPPDHWSYDPAVNALDFSPFHRPEAGSTVVIRYRQDCTTR